jgi:hypothetical protein
MNRLHEFERLIDERLRSLFRGAAPQGEKRELIEVHRAILDEVAARVELLPRGRRVFSYPHLVVRVLLPDPARRRSYEVALMEADTLGRDIAGRLADEQVEMPERFSIAVELVDELPAGVAERGFDISYQSAGPLRAAAPMPVVWLKVLSGTSDRPEYSLRKSRVNIGRLTDVVDSSQRLLRRNDVAFAESSEVPNKTVSRTHAHLEFDAAGQVFRLFDDRSAQGTRVIRDGAIITVPKGASKGVPLKPGDEIVLGQARISFDLHSDTETA